MPISLFASVMLPAWLELAWREPFFVMLSVGVAVLVVLVVGFATSVVVLRVRNAEKARRWNALEAKWEQPLLEALVGERDIERVLELVRPDEQLFFVDYLLRYARRLRGSEREVLTRLARPFLQPIAERTTIKDAERRARAVQTLGELGLQWHADAVVAALDDDSPLVRMIAARALVREDHPEYLPAVLGRFHLFMHWSPNFLASMLAATGPAALPALREAYADATRDPRARAVTATALGYLNDVEAGDMAAHIVETETDTDLVSASLRLLARVGRREHLPIVRARISAQSFAVRAAAASALGAFGDRDDVGRLREAYNDASPWVAIHAARALREVGEATVLRDLAAERPARASLALQVLNETS